MKVVLLSIWYWQWTSQMRIYLPAFNSHLTNMCQWLIFIEKITLLRILHNYNAFVSEAWNKWSYFKITLSPPPNFIYFDYMWQWISSCQTSTAIDISNGKKSTFNNNYQIWRAWRDLISYDSFYETGVSTCSSYPAWSKNTQNNKFTPCDQFYSLGPKHFVL